MPQEDLVSNVKCLRETITINICLVAVQLGLAKTLHPRHYSSKHLIKKKDEIREVS